MRSYKLQCKNFDRDGKTNERTNEHMYERTERRKLYTPLTYVGGMT